MSANGDYPPFVDVREIRRLVGPASFARGQRYAARGAVVETSWDSSAKILTGTVSGSGPRPYDTEVRFATQGSRVELTSRCSCPMTGNCKHVAAILLSRNLASVQQRLRTEGSRAIAAASDGPPGASTPRQVSSQPAWKAALADLVGGVPPRSEARAGSPRPMGLLFELREVTKSPQRWHPPIALPAVRPGPSAELRLAARPVVRSSSGNWVRSTVSWNSVAYPSSRFELNQDHRGWLAQLLALHRSTRSASGFSEADWIYLDDVSTGLLWPLLSAAEDVGVALVSGKRGTAVTVGSRAVLTLEIVSGRQRNELRFAPVVRVDGAVLPAAHIRTVGDSGIYAWQLQPAPHFVLAPTAAPVTPEQRQLLRSPEQVLLPAADVPEFVTGYLPALRRVVPVSSPDGSIELPEPLPPVLVLTATFRPQHRLHLSWQWEYSEGRTGLEQPIGPAAAFRDSAAENAVLARLGALWDSAVLPPAGLLQGLAAAEFTDRELPRIAAVDGVRVEEVGEKPDYRELTATPVLTVSTAETDQRDWFDLGVLVTIAGQKVPFQPIFTALSQGRSRLLLPDNSYLSLDQPVFERLRDLLHEASALSEWDTGVRISRYQASLWADFEDLAEETEQAAGWRAAVAGLLERAGTENLPTVPPPAGLQATLRPYQQEGFSWLAFLWRHRLGGILADDMGLGKTLQALAMIAHARTGAGQPSAPFLVVAPTSVVPNWLAEAARFTPGLVVRGITESEGKSKAALRTQAAGADLLVTSYALFRIDFDAYQDVAWSGLILDEAQFAKNPAAKAHEGAASLNVPFKLAITGTPMENSLTDLWALFAIVAPGLFPSARRFREDYVRPIAAGEASEPLARLRRRIRPLMLRRTKELVAADLPAKQEQELRVELVPRHRKLYDTYLQRERQKLLGLIEDLDRNRFIVFRSLTLLRLLSLDASLVDPAYADIPSAKLVALFEQLEDVLAEGHRALVFSQFTSFLGKAAARLDASAIGYEYLDGSTSKRGEVIARFRTGTAPVFLISLKAGGFGLNLTEADYVFLLDPWWNPAAENQAIDRTHRIGQTRSVNVYRMIAAGTIEEKVMALKTKKSRLFDAVIDDDALFSNALTAQDIRGLLED